jgi:cation diffusion facilitator family transporter
MMPTTPSTKRDNLLVRRASYISLVVSVILLGVKFWGYYMTHSQAVFSDAMETIVNVVTAALSIVVLIYANKPADRDHPYGHGKLEFFSAAFEGGMITFASVLICVQAIQSLWYGSAARELGIGVAVTVGAGVLNAALGLFLYRVGKTNHSSALEASGLHVLSDFWTSVGVVIGLVMVVVTDLAWLDPLAALLVGLWLGWTGLKLVRRSAGGLLDEEDRGSLQNLADLVDRDRPAGIIQVHHVRVIRAGSYHHIDAHAVVPEYWDVSEAHRETDEFESKLIRDYPYSGELHLHVDPCRQAYCQFCEVSDCPIRRQPFERRRKLSIEELVSPDEPKQFQ